MQLRKNCILLSSIILASISSSAFAATECMFQSTVGVDLKFDNNIVLNISKVVPPTSGFIPVSNEIMANSTSPVRSECNTGKGGQLLQARDQSAGEDMDKYYTENGHQYLMYKTSIKGLYYGVKIENSICSDINGYIPPDKSYAPLYDVGDDREKACMNNDADYKFSIKFFVGSNFKGVENQSFTSSVIGNHGSFRISGSAGDVDDRNVTVKAVQINGTTN